MKTPETMTAAECKLWLAKRMKPCSACSGKGLILISLAEPLRDAGIGGVEQVCSRCQGMCLVSMFPTLRKVCGRCYGSGKTFYSSPCWPCQGQGWVVAEVHLEDLLVMAEKAGFDIDISPNLIHLTAHDGSYYRLARTSSERIMEDVILVCVAAVQAQEVKA